MRGTLAVVRNLAKVWGLLLGFAALLGALGWVLGDYRLASIFIFCALLAAVTAWWHGERVALAMVGARKAALAGRLGPERGRHVQLLVAADDVQLDGFARLVGLHRRREGGRHRW